MGCDVGAETPGAYTYSGGTRVEHRRSPTSNCDAAWEITRNWSGRNRYAGGSMRYGAGFPYHQSTRSPGMIAYKVIIYTPMKCPGSSTLTLACGKLSTTGLVPLPVTVNCVRPY